MTRTTRMTQTYLLEYAVLPGGVASEVRVSVADGRFTRVEQVDTSTANAGHEVRIPGLSLPGLANCHSHAFHRALRGHTQVGRGSFWTWREQMYSLAERLDPDSYRALATAVFAEMVASGFTSVGEFHYLHHRAGGRPYADPNAMGHALLDAAEETGIRIRLLDTCYLSAGFGRPCDPVQERFSDTDAESWAQRMNELPEQVRGAAIHSVRAVPEDQLDTVVQASAGIPLHVHLSEQVAENEACRAHTGRTPTRLLHDHGVWGPRASAVHATHLTEEDIALLGGNRVFACFCPTTERDLGDGIGPSRRLHEAGARLTLGSDSHAVIDGFEEMRATEMHERLAHQQRGHWSAAELLDAGTRLGHASLGFDDVGRIEVGQRADLVSIDLDGPRTAGAPVGPELVVFCAGSADVTRVMIDGVVRHEADPDTRLRISQALAATIGALRS